MPRKPIRISPPRGWGHPAADLPASAREVFVALATGHQPPRPCAWVAVLVRRGLVHMVGTPPAETYAVTAFARRHWQAHRALPAKEA